MKRFPLAALAFFLGSCDTADPVRTVDTTSPATIAPRPVATNSAGLPRTDSVHVRLTLADPSAVWFDSTLPWSSKSVVIKAVPNERSFSVLMEGRETQPDGTSAVWWTGSQTGTPATTPSVDVQNLTVPVVVGDTIPPKIDGPADTLLDSAVAGAKLVWTVRDSSLATVVVRSGSGESRTLSPSPSGVVSDSISLGPGESVRETLKAVDRAGNVSMAGVRATRRNRSNRHKLTTFATGGQIALDPAGGVYDSGTVVTATAIGDGNHTFAGWSGACTNGSGTCKISMDRDTTLNAAFVPDFGIPWTPPIAFEALHDDRDGRTYRTVKIGGRTWMAENLNFAGAGVCPGNAGATVAGAEDSCSKYGRLYTWAEAMAADTSIHDHTILNTTLPHRGICPRTWHVPSDAEWQSLEMAVGMDSATAAATGSRGTTASTSLRSARGWSTNTGTDASGFRILPAGLSSEGTFSTKGTVAYFWTASEYDAIRAWFRKLAIYDPAVYRADDFKTDAISLRCIQD